MTDPIFESTSPRFALPLLFAGQAQKEGHVNEALSRIDALLHLAIESTQVTPPASPAEGQCWIVGSSATDSWNGKAGQIACFSGGNWLFAPPRDGIVALDRTSGQIIHYRGGWQQANRPALPSGGTTVDSEARSALSALLTALTTAGILPPA